MTTYNANSSATLITAAASAVSGDTINITSNITAAVTATVLAVATGSTLLVNGFTISGFCWVWDGGTSGQYITPTTITGGNGTFSLTGCDNAAKSASVCVSRGKFILNGLNFTGLGATTTTKQFAAECSSTARVEVTATNCNFANSKNDVVSSGCIGGGVAAAGSFAKYYNCTMASPGTGTADNCLTSHNTVPTYMYGGSLGPAGGGPLFNSAPNDVPFELYDVAINATGNPADCNCSALVRCTITGTPGAGATILIHNVTSQTTPGIACWNSSSMNIWAAQLDTETTREVAIYGNTLTAASRSISQPVGSVLPAMVARNTLAGPSATNEAGIESRWTWKMYNNTINVPAGAVATVYPIRLSSPSSGQNLSASLRCWINKDSRSINYLGRSDSANCAIQLTETVGKSGTAIWFDSSAPLPTITNSTFDGTNPNGYEVGAAFVCNSLKTEKAYGLEGYPDALTPVQDISLYYGLMPATMGSVVANSSSQCTVNFTNNNIVSRDHRIERATDAGFTTGLTQFDVTGIAVGAATYIDTTCAQLTTYYYRVRAKNSSAVSIVSGSASATTPSFADVTPPVVASAAVGTSGATLTVTYTETESAPILPAAGAVGFTLTSSTGMPVIVAAGTRVSSLVHSFTLSRPVYSFETLTLNYSAGNVTDSAAAPNSLASITGRAVTNSSTQLPVLLQAWNILAQAAADAGLELTVKP